MANAKKNPPVRPLQADPSASGGKSEAAHEEKPKPERDDSTSRRDLIRQAAYRRWEGRGSVHGQDEDDWHEAEKEVRPPEGN